MREIFEKMEKSELVTLVITALLTVGLLSYYLYNCLHPVEKYSPEYFTTNTISEVEPFAGCGGSTKEEAEPFSGCHGGSKKRRENFSGCHGGSKKRKEGFANPKIVTMRMFYADWCPHCQDAKPGFKQFMSNNNKVIKGYKLKTEMVDCDKHQQKAAKFGVEGFPTFILTKDGKNHVYQGARETNAYMKYVVSMV